MIKTGKRVLAFAMILSLALGLGVPALAAGQVSGINVTEPTLPVYVGQSIESITLTATGGNFAAEASQDQFSIDVGNTGAEMSVDSVQISDATATLSVTTTTAPTSMGILKITAETTAFDEGTRPTEQLSVELTVSQASGTVSASLSGEDGLYVGTPADGKTITLTATKDNGLSFKEAEQGNFSVSDTGLSISEASGSGESVTLTLGGTPSQAGQLTVTAKTNAFEFPPVGEQTAQITVNAAPAITATAEGNLTHGTAGGTISVNISGNNASFIDNIASETGKFTVTVGESRLNVTSVSGSGQAVTLTMEAPQTKEAVKVTIDKTAFKYYPASNVEASGTVTVNAPTGGITATLNGTLYAGTQVENQTITLKTTGGLTFADGPFTEVSTYFSLSGSEGLQIASASKSDSDVTLTLSGTPKTSGQVTVTAQTSAFKFPPQAAPTAEITVTAAPTVTLEPDASVTVTAGDSTTVQVKINSPDYVKFVNSAATSNFKVSGAGFSGTVSSVQISEDGKTATLTLSAAPTSAGQLTVTVQSAAFTPVAAREATATVTVAAPSGTITATQKGTLTAGQAASGVTVGLTITGTLNFKNSGLSAADFTLDNAAGLQITNVEGSGKNVTLTLTGTPKAGGDYKVKVNTSAFTVKPQDEVNPVEATGSNLTILYPTVTLTFNPNHIIEGEAVGQITVTSDVPFAEITQAEGYFAFSSDDETLANELKLTDATATEGTMTAVLTVEGSTDKTGMLKITAQPQAFQYQPESEVTQTINVGPPEGTLKATLTGELHVGTPVEGQTITVEITESHGLHFQEGVEGSNFQLGGDGAAELSIDSVDYVSDSSVTLHLAGTPTTAGQITVSAQPAAFQLQPKEAMNAPGELAVQAAPEGTVAASLDGTLNAGTAVSDQTITVQAEGLTFKSELAEDLFTLGTGSEGLTVTGVTVDDTGKQATLALTGTPAKAGTFTVTVAQSAFQFWPEAETLDAGTVDIGAAIVSLAVVENTLTAGTEGGSFKLTATGSAFIADVTDLVSMAQGTAQGDMKLVSAQVQEGAVVVTLSGTPATQGTIVLTVSKDAFAPAPAEDVTLEVTVAPGSSPRIPRWKVARPA